MSIKSGDWQIRNSSKEVISEKSKFLPTSSPNEEIKIQFINGPGYLQINPISCDNKEERGEEVDGGNDRRNQSICGSYVGIILSILSGLIFTLGAIIVKHMKGYHPFTLAVYRFQGIFLPSIPLIAYATCGQKQKVFEPIWPLTKNSNWKNVALLVIRGFTGCSAIVCYFYCLRYLTVADAMIICSMKLIFVTLIAHVFLGEKMSIFSMFVAILTILGVGVIMRPPILSGEESFDQNLLIGSLYAFGSVISITITLIIMRYLRKIHVSVVHFIFGTSGMLLTLVLALSFGVFVLPQETNDVLYAIALAAIAFTVQTLTIYSLKKEKAGIVTLVRTSEIVFAMLWQFIFLGVVPDLFSLIGAAIVILGVVLTTWTKWLSSLPEDHHSRKRYFFALK